MKNKSVISYALIGLALAGLGFANFLAQRGSLSGLLNRGEASSTQNDEPLTPADLEKLKFIDESVTYIATESGQASESAQDIDSIGANPISIAPTHIKIEATQSGQTAFSLLVESVPKVTYKQYDFGFYIESINDLKGDENNFWAFYLNGEKSQVGADSVVVKPGEMVEFIYEKVEF